MTDDNSEKNQEKSPDESGGEAENKNSPEKRHPWVDEVGSYPLRQPKEDPSWAVKIVKVWLGIALASGLFILALLILGFFYD
jgi:hypothetical protein